MGITRRSPSSSSSSSPSSSMPLNRAGNNFSVGEAVEVTNNPPGSYFEATVISCLRNGSYVVEYEGLMNDHDDDDDDDQRRHDYSFFTETVYANDLRPRPPPVAVPAADGFSVNQKVDAYENEGWWLTTVAGRRGSNYYLVCTVAGDSEVVVHYSQLRVHQEWICGHWVLP